MFERFTTSARAVVVAAQEEARALGHPEVGAEHLAVALLAHEDTAEAPGVRVLGRLGLTADTLRDAVRASNGLDAEALSSLGIDLSQVRERVEATFGPGALDRPARAERGLLVRLGGHVPFTAGAKKSLEGALREAIAHGDRALGPQHLLLGLLTEDAVPAFQVLRRAGVQQDRSQLRQAVLDDLDAAA